MTLVAWEFEVTSRGPASRGPARPDEQERSLAGDISTTGGAAGHAHDVAEVTTVHQPPRFRERPARKCARPRRTLGGARGGRVLRGRAGLGAAGRPVVGARG